MPQMMCVSYCVTCWTHVRMGALLPGLVVRGVNCYSGAGRSHHIGLLLHGQPINHSGLLVIPHCGRHHHSVTGNLSEAKVQPPHWHRHRRHGGVM